MGFFMGLTIGLVVGFVAGLAIYFFNRKKITAAAKAGVAAAQAAEAAGKNKT